MLKISYPITIGRVNVNSVIVHCGNSMSCHMLKRIRMEGKWISSPTWREITCFKKKIRVGEKNVVESKILLHNYGGDIFKPLSQINGHL